MKTIEIIRNSVMQCIEKIDALLKRMQKTEATVEEQGNNILSLKRFEKSNLFCLLIFKRPKFYKQYKLSREVFIEYLM